MYLIELLLPLHNNAGEDFPASYYESIREELIKKFGGITTFSRAPAEGLWKGNNYNVTKDDIVIFEVMLKKLDKEWWRDYKLALEKIFSQEEIIIRAHEIELIS